MVGQDQKREWELLLFYNSKLTSTIAHELAHTLLRKPATTEDFKYIFESFYNLYEEPDLKLYQIEAAVRETPFANLTKLLPKDRSELCAFLALLLTVLQIIIGLRTSSNAPTITPDQVEEIIERVLDHHEHDIPSSTPPPMPPAPPPTPAHLPEGGIQHTVR